MQRLLTLLIAGLLISSSSLWGQTTSVTISAQSQWESTGVNITSEMTVTIEATGEWCGAPWSCYGPEGTGGIAPGAFLAPGLSSGGLVGKVGNNAPFLVGSLCSFDGQDHGTGTLYLAFNDDLTGYYNNSGTLDVTITTTEAGGLTAPFSEIPPTIDGVIGGTEWQDAQIYNLTFHSNVDQTTVNAPVYLLNDGTFLFCASTVPFSSSSTAYFGIYIDGDNSHSINGTMSEPHVDIGYNKAGTNSPLYPIYDAYWAEVPPCGVLWSDMVTPPSGAEHAYSGTTELGYEFKIPLSDMTAAPGEAVGVHLQFSPNSSIGYMYPSADYCDIASWPDLYIASAGQQGADILIYSTSGTYPASSFDGDLVAILQDAGFSVAVTDRVATPTITSQLLSGYDELWVLSTNPYSGSGSFSGSEISDIMAFRDAGNGILVMADDGPPGHSYIGDANQISTPLGVTFSGEYNYGPYSQPFEPDFSPHPLFDGVQSIVCTEAAAVLGVSSPSEAVASYQGVTLIAALDDGNGRAVFDVSFARLFDGDILLGNTPQYVRNIAGWLSGGGQPSEYEPYLTEKTQLITDILGIERPWFGFDEPFFEQAENSASSYVNTVNTDYQAGIADPVDMEAVARLTLSERVTKQAMIDAIDISEYGAKGLKALSFAWVTSAVFRHLAKAVEKIPFIGEGASKLLKGAAKDISRSTHRLMIAYHTNFRLPPGQLTLSEWAQAEQSTQEFMTAGKNVVSLATAEKIENNLFDTDIFETADHIIQDYTFLSVLEAQSIGGQTNAVNRAAVHDFPEGLFFEAAADATNTLNDMSSANQFWKDVLRWQDTIRELSSWAVLILSLIAIVAGILAAIFTGGASLLLSIAGIATFLLTWGTLLTTSAAISESAVAAAYVNAAIPYIYVNPSADQAFGPFGQVQFASADGGFEPRVTNYAKPTHYAEVLDYYTRLHAMVVSWDTTWATNGIDSLDYYEDLARQDEDRTIADLLAASVSAHAVITGFGELANAYIVRTAARDIYSAGIEISGFVYRNGYRDPTVVSAVAETVDSTANNYVQLNLIREALYDSLETHSIPIPTTVGVGKIGHIIYEGTLLSAMLSVEVVNFGTEEALGIQIFPYLTSVNAAVVGDTIVTLDLGPADTSVVTFELTSTDSIIVGAVFVQANHPDAPYYTMPSKAFTIDFRLDKTYGSVSGTVSDSTSGLLGVNVDVYDADGVLLQSRVTDDSGYHHVDSIPNGDYSIMVVTPLGYQAVEETKEVTIAGEPVVCDFTLTQLDITPQQRSRAYWAHQLHKALQNKPKDYTLEDFSGFAGLINVHFNQNQVNPVDFYSVPQPADQSDSLTVLKKLLHMQNTGENEPLLKRLAKSQLMALMLNVVSGKVSQTHEISADGRTVSQLITYCDMLVGDEIDPPNNNGCPGHGSPWFRYIYASFMLVKANLGLTVPAGMIPEDIIQIAYKQQHEEILPTEFALYQNYPNPFNPTTEISFALPNAANVKLEVFNIMGQRVATLVDQHLEAGNHSVVWDGSPVASGIYFYRIDAGDYVESRKMVLLK